MACLHSLMLKITKKTNWLKKEKKNWRHECTKNDTKLIRFDNNFDLGTFCNTKHIIHRFTLNLHGVKIMILKAYLNISCWGAVIFEKWVKQCHESKFLHAKIFFVSWSPRQKNYFHDIVLLIFSKTIPTQQEVFFYHYLQTVYI